MRGLRHCLRVLPAERSNNKVEAGPRSHVSMISLLPVRSVALLASISSGRKRDVVALGLGEHPLTDAHCARGGGACQSHAMRSRTARTVEGHHRAPPCAVGVPAVFSSRAIWARLWPALRFARIASTSVGESVAGRPGFAGVCGCSRARRRRSAINRSSSSAGISRVPQGISTVSMSCRTRLLNVDLLTPSALAACVRV